MRGTVAIVRVVGLLLFLGACGETRKIETEHTAPEEPSLPGTAAETTPAPTYAWINENVFKAKCLSCHNAGTTNSGVNLETYDTLQTSASAHGHAFIKPGNTEGSHLYQMLQSGQMPKGGPKLPDNEIAAIGEWIKNGAKND